MPDTYVKTKMIDPSPRLEGLLYFSSGLDQMEEGVSLPLVLGWSAQLIVPSGPVFVHA